MRKRLTTVLMVMRRSERFYLALVVPGGIEPALLLVFDPQVFLVSASQISVVRKKHVTAMEDSVGFCSIIDVVRSNSTKRLALLATFRNENTTREQQKEINLCSRFQRPYFSNDLQN